MNTLPPPPARRPTISRGCVVALVLATITLASAGLGGCLVFGYFAGDMAVFQGPVTSTTPQEVCIEDEDRGRHCLSRSDIRVTNPSAAIPDADAIVVGHCLSYIAPRTFQHAVEVRAYVTCQPATTTTPPTTTG